MNKSRTTSRWRLHRSILVVGVHLAAFVIAYGAAFVLRTEYPFTPEEVFYFCVTLASVLVIKSMIFQFFGQYRTVWRSVTFSDLASLFKASTLSLLVIATLYFMMMRHGTLSRVIPFIDWALTILILGGLRAGYRFSREELRFSLYRSRNPGRKALIVGANQSGINLARHNYCNRHAKYNVLGFLDADPAKVGSMMGGLPVLGPPERAPKIAERLGIDDLLVISGTLTGKQLRGLMEDCEALDITFKVIPGLEDLLEADYSPQVRDVNIDDLLRREPVQLSSDEIGTLLAGRTILVTGAGGSIGSEICRQVLRFHPAKLVLIERAENSLFLIEQEIRRSKTATVLAPCIADITDAKRMDQIFAGHQPAVVFHAAAHKHVPMMEDNPGEAIKNNVLGTITLVESADKHGVQEFVMISTDKAVNPTSVMGVSKQIAERYVHAFSEVATTKFVVVRFGNVLASAGSVVPIFQEQIRLGGPITVTHPEIERYFMTIPEASQLVLQAAAMGKGGEIFVLDMGESVRIVDLAQDLIRLSGLDPDQIEIVFTGLRPGEKLYEELYFDDEEMLPTPHPKLFVAYHRPYRLAEVTEIIESLRPDVDEPGEVICRRLRELISEYAPPDAALQLPHEEAAPTEVKTSESLADANGHADAEAHSPGNGHIIANGHLAAKRHATDGHAANGHATDVAGSSASDSNGHPGAPEPPLDDSAAVAKSATAS
jgi:FlaA1/EpsC-like NDP-sugar epimerase